MRTAPDNANERFILFQLGAQSYAIALAEVQEVVPLPLLSQPPGLPAILAGVFTLEGNSVAVLRLDHLFGGQSVQSGLYTPLIVLRDAGLPLALMVDEVRNIVLFEPSAILPLPSNTSANECASGAVLHNGAHVIILDVHKILLKAESQWIAQLLQAEQSRLATLELAVR